MYRTLCYIELSTQVRTGFYYLQKHKKIWFFIFNLDFENCMQHLAMYIILVKIVFLVYIKVAFTVFFIIIRCSCEACHSTSMRVSLVPVLITSHKFSLNVSFKTLFPDVFAFLKRSVPLLVTRFLA